MPKYRLSEEDTDISTKALIENIKNLRDSKEFFESQNNFVMLKKTNKELLSLLKEFQCYFPSNEILIEISELQEEIGDKEGMIETLRQLCSLNPNDKDHVELLGNKYISLAWKFFYMDKSEEAIEMIGKALKIVRDFNKLHPGKEIGLSITLQSQEILSKL